LIYLLLFPIKNFIKEHFMESYSILYHELDVLFNIYKYKSTLELNNFIIDISDIKRFIPNKHAYKNIDWIVDNNKRVVKIKSNIDLIKYLNYLKYFKLFITEKWSAFLILLSVVVFYLCFILVVSMLAPNRSDYCLLQIDKYICEKEVYMYWNDKWVIITKNNIFEQMNNSWKDYKIFPVSEVKKISPSNN
jgi:hypothetical protein